MTQPPSIPDEAAALRELAQYLLLRPDDTQALRCHGALLLRADRAGEAVADFRRAPDHVGALIDTGLAPESFEVPAVSS